MARLPRVFTIAASAPFLPTLIEALLDGRLIPGFGGDGDPLRLADATLYLPTRRACRLARDVFLGAGRASAAILPRIVAIGDIDEDELAFAQAAAGPIAPHALDLPPAMNGLERRLLLTRLIQSWAERLDPGTPGEAPLVAGHPAAALALADDLARLIDDMATRNVPWDRLDELVPDHLDRYWQLTLEFLKIARVAWPAILTECGTSDAALRRDALLKAEAARLRQGSAPVIVAGSTGSIPATAELIAVVAGLPHGAVVLPGLDTELDEQSWALIDGEREASMPTAGHPQFAMRALLQRIGILREAVEALGAPASHGRELLASEAFRPAAATDQWRSRTGDPRFAAHAAAAIDGLTLVEAANAEEEALAIAIALREALNDADKTAALVTPDRALARRVLASLARWQVAVDDSGGDALADTSAGVFARLVADVIAGAVAPVELLALLKHPLAHLGAATGAHRHAIATLERAVLRGPRPRAGSAGLAGALATFRVELDKLRQRDPDRAGERSALHPSDPRTRLHDADVAAAADLVERLRAALAPLESLAAGPCGFDELATRHRDVVAALSHDRDGAPAAFAGDDGSALAFAFDEIAAGDAAARLRVGLADYPDLFTAAIADRVVRRPGRAGVRVRVLGPLEARLTTVDRIVLGGLNEGTWPPEARSDAWLSRPMRLALGLDLPERRIGLSAHDFAQLLGAREVILTRAGKIAGAPTVASRFVQRLAAVAGPRWGEVRERGERYLAWARALDRPAGPPRPAPRPAPTPPLAARPTRLTVTEIEHWLRDPYTIYAKHVLRLLPLDPIDTAPGAADRGTVIHGAIGDFSQAYAGGLPADPLKELLALGRSHFAALEDFPEARAFWWPRFERIARWFADWDARRRTEIQTVQAEIRGEIEIGLGDRSLRLSARADRIERLADGTYAILDYKTGSVPTGPQVVSGLAPQLTLEAAILRAGKFPGIPPGASIAELIYVALKGGNPGGEAKCVDLKNSNPDHEADRALQRLAGVAHRFEDVATPYRSFERPMWIRRTYGDYDHLARVREWSLSGEDEDEAMGPPA